jgi:hypothetical protein
MCHSGNHILRPRRIIVTLHMDFLIATQHISVYASTHAHKLHNCPRYDTFYESILYLTCSAEFMKQEVRKADLFRPTYSRYKHHYCVWCLNYLPCSPIFKYVSVHIFDYAYNHTEPIKEIILSGNSLDSSLRTFRVMTCSATVFLIPGSMHYTSLHCD